MTLIFLIQLKTNQPNKKAKNQHCEKIPAKMVLWKLCEQYQLVQNSCLLENKATGPYCSQHMSTGTALLSRVSTSSHADQVMVCLKHLLTHPCATKSQDTWCTGHSLLKKIIFVRLLF